MVGAVGFDSWGQDAAKLIAYEDQDWPSDPWSRGCYMASPGPGILSSVGAVIREPHGRVHWAGTETADRWAGYIDGAVRSGERAAGEVLERMAQEVDGRQLKVEREEKSREQEKQIFSADYDRASWGAAVLRPYMARVIRV